MRWSWIATGALWLGCAGCAGSQRHDVRAASATAGTSYEAVPLATMQEDDWLRAATASGAAGTGATASSGGTASTTSQPTATGGGPK